MSNLTWTTHEWPGHNYYTAADGQVTVMHFENAVGAPWRVQDFRGVSPETPKPVNQVLSFHRTVTAAKAHAEAAVEPSAQTK